MNPVDYDKVKFWPSTPNERDKYRDLLRVASDDIYVDAALAPDFEGIESISLTPVSIETEDLEQALHALGFRMGINVYVDKGLYIIDHMAESLNMKDLRTLASNNDIAEVLLRAPEYSTIVS